MHTILGPHDVFSMWAPSHAFRAWSGRSYTREESIVPFLSVGPACTAATFRLAALAACLQQVSASGHKPHPTISVQRVLLDITSDTLDM